MNDDQTKIDSPIPSKPTAMEDAETVKTPEVKQEEQGHGVTSSSPGRMSKQQLFHVTSVDAAEQILSSGLKGNRTPRYRGFEPLERPTIFALASSDERLTDSIAKNQIWPHQDIRNYAVIEIHADGIHGEICADNIPENTAPWHRAIVQEVVECEYLQLLRIRELNYPHTVIQDILTSYKKRKWTSEEWKVAREWVETIILEPQAEFESVLRTKD